MSQTPAPQRSTPAWHTLPAAAAAGELGADLERGLSAAEAAARLQRHGPNSLAEGRRRTLLHMIADQFRDVVIWVLLGAVAISVVMGDYTDAAVIIAIVLLNAVLGVVQESKAEQSLAALQAMAAPVCHALRDGAVREVPSAELVPGDVVVLETGNLVPADLRLTETANLKVEEASLTGESLPVQKHAGRELPADADLGDRLNLAFSGTTVVHGRGRGLVTATGEETEIGRIAEMLGQVEAEKTPLQERLERLGKGLALLVLGISAIVFIAGWLRGLPLEEMLLTAVSLAVAAIPEGLPAVVTVVLAVGMTRIVRRHVIVRRLRAVEALGSTTVICTDKTGTLTQNQMTVRRFWACDETGEVTGSGYAPEGSFRVAERPVEPLAALPRRRMLEAAVLCNDAALGRGEGGEWRVTGDPTEGALLALGAKAGLDRAGLEAELPRVAEAPFESDRKRMSTVHRLPGGGYRVYTKGAPGMVFERCSGILCGETVRPFTPEDRERLLGIVGQFADEALRVLGFAYRDLPEVPADVSPDTVEQDLVFTGLVGMIDPPREEVRDSVRVCREAGIRPVMITGDYVQTARAIARDLEWGAADTESVNGAELRALSETQLGERVERISLYARVSPADKLRIVEAWQRRGHIVAMTGDGVNDAPALKQSDIGVAMGVTGTDVAKGAADIVLMDDNFASIVAAVEEGRGIFANIRKFVFYLLSCNISEVLTIFAAIMIGLPQPLLAVQILWVNLITDGLPALALGMEPKEPGLMQRPPRDPREGVLDRGTALDVVIYGGFITLATLAAYLHGVYWFCLQPHGHAGLEAFRVALDPKLWAALEMEAGLREARTLAFGTLAFSQLAHALNSRSETLSLFQLRPWTNPHLLGAVALSAGAQLLVIHVPLLNRLFETTPVHGWHLLVGVGLSVSPLVFGELLKAVRRRSG